jgi:predicted permease
MAAVALLLILACANVANLFLARSQSRKQEMAILAAIGAGRAHLARRLLIESLLLSLTGGILGLFIGYWGKEMIEYYLLQGTPVGMGSWGQASSLTIDERIVALYVFGISLLTGLLFGLAPVAQTLRTNLVTALKSNASSARGKRIFEMRKILVIVQVALSVVLLLGAGLLVRTLSAAKNQKLGFEARNLMLAAVYMSPARSGDPSESKAAYQDLLERIGALSGVESASLVQMVPVSGLLPALEVQLPQQLEKQSIYVNVIAPAYFETMKIPVLKGRSFEQRDSAERPAVVIVNQAAARKLWPNQDPIGQRMHIQGDDDKMESSEVIGVVADSRFARIVDPIQPQIYFTFQQRYRPRMTFVIRASVRIDAQVRDILRQNYPDMAVIDLVPFSEQIRRSMTDQRMNADVAASFGFLGLLLAGTGIFSVMSYTVSRRQREFGVRMAVGATQSDISGQVLKEAGRLIAIGVLIGAAAAWALGKVITSILYGVGPHDLLTFLVVTLALTAIALIAAWIPAHRASRVNPLTALREQ